MSFDYSPPRWWTPVLVLAALLGLALAGLLSALLCLGVWQLFQALSGGADQALFARVTAAVGPFR
jgi:hypothetical protein